VNQVYITKLSSYLPNNPIESEEIEDVLGKIGGLTSRSRRIVLKSNGIKKRYYALNKDGVNTHTNAQLTSEAVKQLFDQDFKQEDLELLCCGTSTPDQVLPSHAVMVHGYLGGSPFEVASLSGICCSGMHALKYGYMSVLSGQSSNAVCTGSELVSPYLIARNFEKEFKTLEELEARPILAFEKEFLRWMLSDGAGALLIENKPGVGLSLRIDWMESISYANEQPACMYGGAEKMEDGNLRGWMTYSPEEWSRKSLFSIKQDVKLLEKNIVRYGGKKLALIVQKRNIKISEIDYFLPHLSSEFFRKKIQEELVLMGVDIPAEKWFTNLSEVGNMGSASIYVIIDALVKSGNLKKGQKILIMVPESGRFSYVYAHLTVV
jgi:3-oxoacyl-[acyl-carrier-protein] synthase-3